MRSKKKIGYRLLIAFFFYTPAMNGQYKFDQPVIISKEQGLPTNDIRSIKKGKDGFMWLGTSDGLCRFDGQQVKTYISSIDSIAAIGSSVFSVLPVDKDIWMGTTQGIAVFNTVDETFRRYQLSDKGKMDSVTRRFDQSVAIVYMDRQGELWFGTRERGVWMYDKKKDDFKKFDYPASAYKEIIPAIGSNKTILSIEASQTNDSIIWAGTTAGLEEINKYNGKVNWYTFPQKGKDYQVALNAFRRLYHHDDGLLYVGSWEAGVNVFDPVAKTFTPLIVKDDTAAGVLKGTISGIQRKGKDEIWITTIRGLVVYNTQQHAITWFKFNQPLQYEFYGVDYVDEDNRVWHANINGVQYYDPVVQQFTTYSFQHLFSRDWAFSFYIETDKTGNNITVCPRMGDGLYQFDRQKNKWTASRFNGVDVFPSGNFIVRGFIETRPGEYIISSDEGLYSYSLQSRKIFLTPGQPTIPFRRWGDIVSDGSGNLWLGADADGLVKWNLTSGQYRIYKKELTLDGTGSGFLRPNNLFRDSHDNIWFSRAGGFSVHLAATDSVLNFLYSADPKNSFPIVNSYAEDRNGKLWVGSGDSWYGYVDLKHPEKGIVQKFDLREKNIGGSFYNMATDPQGNVWGGALNDLVRINAEDMSLSAFSFAYGSKAASDFYHISFLPGGDMLFGGRNCITITNPSGLKRNTELPVPYIFQLKLLNQPVNASLYAASKSLDLRYRQNFISIFFSAQAYTMASAVKFRYRLKNFDDWAESNASRLANYTNIPPGDYVFQLQAANNEGVWNEKMLELPIHIAKPWWQTWLFRIAATLLVVGLVYWWYQYRIDQVRKKEQVKAQYEKKLANVEMTALLAQMNPHFLFNSLNSIDSYIIKNESGKASEYLNNFARLMRLILQNSRSNYISLKDELEALDLYLQMEALRFKDKFQYEIKLNEGIDTASIVIPPMLIQPYVENAIWHGLMHKTNGQAGKVEIIISRQENNLICVVQDNGIGREKAKELKEQKHGPGKRSMGMQITSDRIEMINKLYNTNTRVRVFDLRDEEGNSAGTCVKLIIPF